MPDLITLNTNGHCPDCDGTAFQVGPQTSRTSVGQLGACNIRCVGCGHAFWFSPPLAPQRVDHLTVPNSQRVVDLPSFIKG